CYEADSGGSVLRAAAAQDVGLRGVVPAGVVRRYRGHGGATPWRQGPGRKRLGLACLQYTWVSCTCRTRLSYLGGRIA
ncbi:unnamed protein product, partial [Ectocarpus fasciculatus]